jgi:guanine deaminase
LAVGAHHDLAARFSHLTPTHWPDLLLAPGFVDMHIHYPQTDVIGSPAEGLLPWLTRYTFVEEARFAKPAHAQAVAEFFVAELLRNGVTTAMAFATSHPASVTALMQAAQARRMRLITGKVLQDRHSPDGVRDETEQSLRDTEDLLCRWHGVDRLGYAITPRFAPTCPEAQLRGAGEIAHAYPDVWVQSHVSENLDEIRWVQELFPQASSYLGVYADCGLLRERAVYAHCIHFDANDRALIARSAAAPYALPATFFWEAATLILRRQTRRRCAMAWLATWAVEPASRPFKPCWRRTMWAATARPKPASALRPPPCGGSVRRARRRRSVWRAS